MYKSFHGLMVKMDDRCEVSRLKLSHMRLYKLVRPLKSSASDVDCERYLVLLVNSLHSHDEHNTRTHNSAW